MGKKIENTILIISVISLLILSGFLVNLYFNDIIDKQQSEFDNYKKITQLELEEVKNMSLLKSKYLLESENERVKLLSRINKLDKKIDDYKDDIDDYRDDIENLEDDIENLENEVINLDDPQILGNISNQELYTLLTNKINVPLYISDRIYSLTSVEKAEIFNEETKVAYNKWLSEEFDCDEFAAALYGFWNLDNNQFAFGIAWSNTHAFNIMIDEDLQVWIIEPQNNKFIKIENAVGQYEISRFVII